MKKQVTKNSPPAAVAPRNIGLEVIAAIALIAAAALAYAPILQWLVKTWSNSPDMSHGFLIPVFSLGLLWHRRAMRPEGQSNTGGSALAIGLTILVLSLVMRAAGIYYRTLTLEAWSLIPFVLGLVFCCGGKRAALWAWPSVLFLVFMFPVPPSFAGMLSASLQKLATTSSTYILQLLGIPAVAQGNIIWLTEESIGVAEACNGLRMLTSFFALAIGGAFLVDRPLFQKFIVIATAPLIAIASNVVRIVVTGITFEFSTAELAEMIFHDLAGWLMMPLGVLLLVVELIVLSKLFIEDPRDEFEPVRRARPA